MIFGNTVSYRSTPSGNFASLSNYLQADVWALRRQHTGHAINPVPVTENERIPDVDEIIDAQIFAARLVEQATASEALVDRDVVDEVAAKLVEGGRRFAQDVLDGLDEARRRPFRRRRTHAGAASHRTAAARRAFRRGKDGRLDAEHRRGGRMVAGTRRCGGRVGRRAPAGLQAADPPCRAQGLRRDERRSRARQVSRRPRVRKARRSTSSTAETSTDPEELVAVAIDQGADFVAVSTYNGIALRYAGDVAGCLARADLDFPVCIGGRLNQVPDDTNSGLPVDVTDDIDALGLTPCASLDDLTPLLRRLAEVPTAQQRKTRQPEGNAMQFTRMINVVGVHAGGELNEVITGGVRDVPGETMFEKMRHVETNDDWLRLFLLKEPRGHITQCVNLVLPATDPRADVGFVIIESDYYVPMSGTNTICTVTALLETGMLPMREPVTRLTLEAPAGLVPVTAECRDGKCVSVTFDNVPGFVFVLDKAVDVPGLGTIRVDVAYGGMIYALVDAPSLASISTMRRPQSSSRSASGSRPRLPSRSPPSTRRTRRSIPLTRRCSPGRSAREPGSKRSRNTVIVSPGRHDRSPCGTGTSARLAVHARARPDRGGRDGWSMKS